MKLSELDAFDGNAIHVRRFEVRVPMQTDIAVTLIVCQDQDNVRLPAPALRSDP